MRYLSVCSGIEAATVAWDPLGFEPVAFSEVEPFPSAVLAQHYADVPNLGDMTQIDGRKYNGSVDLLVGGTPCQSFSVAGLRGGMADPRGNLALAFLGLVDTIRPRYFVWENVPGVLSSSGGRDFGSFVSAVAQLGYRGGWRVLDAAFFGVAQRRKRVFFVGCSAAAERSPREVLFERESLCGDPPPSREAGQGTSPGTRGGAPIAHALNGHGGAGRFDAESETLIPAVLKIRAGCEGGGQREGAARRVESGAFFWCQGGAAGSIAWTPEGSPTLKITKPPAVLKIRAGCEGGGKGPLVGEDQSFTLATGGDQTLFAPLPFDTTQVTSPGNYSSPKEGDPVHPLAAGAHPPAVASEYAVRRLTPIECERLQGFPDDYTRIPWKRKAPEDCPDGPRYKALGNSMAVPVMRWIGSRIVD